MFFTTFTFKNVSIMNYSKILLFFLLPYFIQITAAQTYDEDVVMKACSCIYNEKNDSISVDSVVNSCLIKALLHSLKEDGISQHDILKKYNVKNADSINYGNHSFFGEYLESLYKNCSATHYYIEKKQNRYYKMSNSENANRHYQEGTDYEKQNSPDSAISAYNDALRYDSLFVKALDNAAALYGKIFDTEKSIEYCKKSLNIFPEGFNALVNIGAAYLANEDQQNALKVYTKLIKYYPENAEGYFGLGSISFYSGDYISSVNLMKQACVIYSANGSEQAIDCKEYLKTAYYYMKESGENSLFMEMAPEYAPKIYQPGEFEQLQNIDLKNEIDCRLAEPQILICADYILSTPIDEKNIQRVYAITAVKKWMEKTPNYIFNVDKNVAKILDRKGNVLSVFAASMVKFSIENPEKGNNKEEVAAFAWKTTLNYAADKSNKVELTKDLKKMIKNK